jgi:hypothetical protein
MQMIGPLYKPLGMANYPSIPHLPESRLGPKDYHAPKWQADICTKQVRDSRDVVIVTEKLDGANVGIVRRGRELIAIGRGGYRAIDSEHDHIRQFSTWVDKNRLLFLDVLADGERCVGEWMILAHSTRYVLPHDPFVVFDLMVGRNRRSWNETVQRCDLYALPIPHCLSEGPAVSIASILEQLEPSRHGAVGLAEGAVWRVERDNKFDFMTKFVRHEKLDGALLPQVSGKPAVWNVEADYLSKSCL